MAHMSISVGKRIKAIRESLGMKREEFSVQTGVPNGTLIGIEQGRHEPKAGVLLRVADLWPEYAAYLLTDKIYIPQQNPEIIISKNTGSESLRENE